MDRLPPLDETALFLDLDGTLVPLAPRPEDVYLPDGTLRLLQGLQGTCAGALALISGRDRDSLRPLLRDLPITMISGHGAAMHDASNEVRWETEVDIDGYTRLHAALKQLIAPWARVWIEQKSHGLAVHFRQNPDAWPALDDALDALSLQHPAFPITRGHCVVEFHVSDVDKGKGLTRAMQHPPFVGRMPVMIGDDVTDESAFEQANRAGGLSVRVGDSLENSAATFLVPTPFNLLGLLHAWLSASDTTPLLREFARPRRSAPAVTESG